MLGSGDCETRINCVLWGVFTCFSGEKLWKKVGQVGEIGASSQVVELTRLKNTGWGVVLRGESSAIAFVLTTCVWRLFLMQNVQNFLAAPYTVFTRFPCNLTPLSVGNPSSWHGIRSCHKILIYLEPRISFLALLTAELAFFVAFLVRVLQYSHATSLPGRKIAHSGLEFDLATKFWYI